MSCPFQEFRHLLAFAQPHVGLLPIRSPAGEPPLPLHFPVGDARPDAVDLRPEQALDRPPDLGLVRLNRDLKLNRPPVLALNRGFLRDQRPADDVGELHASASCSFSSALLVTPTRRASITSRALSRALGTTDTPGMFRTDRDSFSSAATSTRTALPLTPRRPRSSAATLVLASLNPSASTISSWPC